jgi:excisionase family DNA binding protein
VRVELELNGARVPVILDEAALDAIAAALAEREPPSPPSPFLTVPEAACYLRCSRQRVDDLLSQRRLQRFKDGTRTLVSRDELAAYVAGNPLASGARSLPSRRGTPGARRQT